jgi:hypothetical protein
MLKFHYQITKNQATVTTTLQEILLLRHIYVLNKAFSSFLHVEVTCPYRSVATLTESKLTCNTFQFNKREVNWDIGTIENYWWKSDCKIGEGYGSKISNTLDNQVTKWDLAPMPPTTQGFKKLILTSNPSLLDKALWDTTTPPKEASKNICESSFETVKLKTERDLQNRS